jgi:uncharacterized protein
MTLQQQLQNDLKEALRAKDTVRLQVIRGVQTAIMNHLVATDRTPQTPLPDDEVLVVIEKELKKRKDSEEQYVQAGRPELAESEAQERVVLEVYVPEKMSLEDFLPLARAEYEALGITKKEQQGMLIGALMKKYKGQVASETVKQAVDQLYL